MIVLINYKYKYIKSNMLARIYPDCINIRGCTADENFLPKNLHFTWNFVSTNDPILVFIWSVLTKHALNATCTHNNLKCVKHIYNCADTFKWAMHRMPCMFYGNKLHDCSKSNLKLTKPARPAYSVEVGLVVLWYIKVDHHVYFISINTSRCLW